MRQVVVMTIAVYAVTAVLQAQSAQTPYPHWLLQASTMSKNLTLSVQDTGESFVVLLNGRSFPDNVPFKPFENITVQAWLLRHDGTAQPREKTPPGTLGLSNAGTTTEIMILAFVHSSPKDIAAVVVNANGEMFVRKIE